MAHIGLIPLTREKAINYIRFSHIWKFNCKYLMALMAADHMDSRFVFEKAYFVVIIGREEWSANSHESFEIIYLIILIDWSVTDLSSFGKT